MKIDQSLEIIHKSLSKKNECAIFDGYPYYDNPNEHIFKSIGDFFKHYDFDYSAVRNLFLASKKYSHLYDVLFIDHEEYSKMFKLMNQCIQPFLKDINIKPTSIPICDVLKKFYYSLTPQELVTLRDGLPISHLSSEAMSALDVVCNYFYIYDKTLGFTLADNIINNNKTVKIIRNIHKKYNLSIILDNSEKYIPLTNSNMEYLEINKIKNPVFKNQSSKFIYSVGMLIDKISLNDRFKLKITPELRTRRLLVLGNISSVPTETLLRGLSDIMGVVFRKTLTGYEISPIEVRPNNDIRFLTENLLNCIPKPLKKYAKTPAGIINYQITSSLFPEVDNIKRKRLNDQHREIGTLPKFIHNISLNCLEHYLDDDFNKSKKENIAINEISFESKSLLCLYFASDVLSAVNTTFTSEKQFVSDRKNMFVKFSLQNSKKNRPLANFQIYMPGKSSGEITAEAIDIWISDQKNAPRLLL